MENNKPEWLRKAEEEQAKFSETKFGKMTDGEIAQCNALENHKEQYPELHEQYREKALDAGWRNPEVQSPLGVKGGTKTASYRLESGYFQSEKWKQSQSKGGKTSGDNNVKSGHFDNIRKDAIKASHAHVTCPKCGNTGSVRNIKPIHFDNCIYPKMLEIISNYIKPEEELSIVKLSKDIAKDLNISSIGRVQTALKRNFLEPGVKPSRYQKWKLKQS
tara:strand:- start:387 stop:1040 length:654 start_codon:yes stop_codon:yes gene_type:complete